MIIEKREENTLSLVQEVIELSESVASQKSIHLEKKIEGQSGKVSCDHEKVLQVFSNLIDNAIRFTPENGKVVIGAKSNDQAMTFSITDGGIGIPYHEKVHFFDRLWQVSSSFKNGSSLGTSIAKGIVESHGGRIWIESELGQGSTIYFTLPHLSESLYPSSMNQEGSHAALPLCHR